MKTHHIPNVISIARIGLVWPIVHLLLDRQFNLALVLMVIAGLSDALDGWLARHYHWQSRLGSYLDPAADKLLLVTGYIALASMDLLPVWLVATVVLRDAIILIGALAYYLLVGPFDGQPLIISKLNTFLQLVLLITVIISQSIGIPLQIFLDIASITVFITTVVSGISYAYIWGKRYYRERLINPSDTEQ